MFIRFAVYIPTLYVFAYVALRLSFPQAHVYSSVSRYIEDEKAYSGISVDMIPTDFRVKLDQLFLPIEKWDLQISGKCLHFGSIDWEPFQFVPEWDSILYKQNESIQRDRNLDK
jgi:hypothetical protein